MRGKRYRRPLSLATVKPQPRQYLAVPSVTNECLCLMLLQLSATADHVDNVSIGRAAH